MNKFTKGKWIANGYVVESEDGKTIADCGFSDKGVDEEEKANVRVIGMIPDMVVMIDELSSELHTLILEVNLHRSRVINSQTETEPDYWDMQSCHEAQTLLKQIKGE